MDLVEISGEKKISLAKLFDSPYGGFLTNAILEGQTGTVYADSQNGPTFAVLELSDIPVSFLGGDASHPLAKKYIEGLTQITQLFINSPQFIPVAYEAQPGKIVEKSRWGFTADNLDLDKLKAFQTKIPTDFTLKKIDLDIVKQLGEKKNEFASIHGTAFKSAEDFIENGVGFCVTKDDDLACVGSSFVVCQEGIEIQINTNPKYQGKGLATAVAASLMIYCIENDLEPGWDAATPVSAKLAEKLGYTPLGEYKMIVYTNSRLLVMLRNLIRGFRRLIGRQEKNT